jgi:hypothetical protein
MAMNTEYTTREPGRTEVDTLAGQLCSNSAALAADTVARPSRCWRPQSPHIRTYDTSRLPMGVDVRSDAPFA